jgi:DNA-binding Lrp family transcriptional regulator
MDRYSKDMTRDVDYTASNREPSDEIQAAILDYLRKHGSATNAELADAAGIKRTAVVYHVKKLLVDGKVAVLHEKPDARRLDRFRVWHPIALARACAALLARGSKVAGVAA